MSYDDIDFPMPAPGWMPVETAPRDGTEIILTDGADVAAGFWDNGDHRPRGEGRWLFECDRGNEQTARRWHPTHWQWLPDPPAT